MELFKSRLDTNPNRDVLIELYAYALVWWQSDDGMYQYG